MISMNNVTDVEILSVGGRAKVAGIVVPPYPEMIHISKLEERMVAELKINGYNCRIFWLGDDFTSILRGGMVDKKTVDLLHKHFESEFKYFFERNPKKVLCIEVIGKKTMANYKGDKDIDYFVFDIMDLERAEEERFLRYNEVKRICDECGLEMVDIVGEYENLSALEKEMLAIDLIYDGVVLKSLDGNRIMKYKWEDNPELFKNKIKPKERKVYIESLESRIVGHFFQGYGEPELGLRSGITQDELKEYEKRLEELTIVEKSKIGKVADGIVEFLMEKIVGRGSFDQEMQRKIEKEFRTKIGREVGRILKRMN